MERNRRRGQKIETAEFATHQIGIRTTNARPENQYVTVVKEKDISRMHVDSNTENDKKFKKITEAEETEESNTDKSINIVTEVKQLIDPRNHITTN